MHHGAPRARVVLSECSIFRRDARSHPGNLVYRAQFISEALQTAKELMSMNSLTHDAQEGISSFLEKRTPCWTGQLAIRTGWVAPRHGHSCGEIVLRRGTMGGTNPGSKNSGRSSCHHYFLGSEKIVSMGFPPLISGKLLLPMTLPSPEVTATY
jgi:hypothetical protein